eukprot:516379-Pelagomonas_calceolata.AAC.1
MDSINHIALRCLHPSMNGMHTDGTMLALAPVLKPSAKADVAHPLLVWTPAKMRDSSGRAYESLKTSPKLSLTGFSLQILALLPDTKAALMLSLCAPSLADPHTLILLRSSRQGHSSCCTCTA